AVDTHVTRVCKHHQIVEKNATPKDIEKRVCEVIPPELWGAAHQAMINFGREICHPRNPQCEHFPQLYACLENEQQKLMTYLTIKGQINFIFQQLLLQFR